MGLPPKEDGIYSKLSDAIKQINTSYAEYVRGDYIEFARLPRDRKCIGLVITSDPIYYGNSPTVREKLRKTNIPTIIASHRDLERMAGWDAATLGRALVSIVNDRRRRTYNLVTSLDAIQKPRPNRILSETIELLPIFAWLRARESDSRE
jgi:hypothetical protein